MNSRIVIAVSTLTIAVGAIVFGYFTTQSLRMDRSQFKVKKLTVVSYPAFISSYGPGPELARRFEKRTGIAVDLVNAGDPSLFIKKLSSDNSIGADVVIGIDQLLEPEAEKLLTWRQLPEKLHKQIQTRLRILKSKAFVPIDWSPLTIVYRRSDMKRSLPSVPQPYPSFAEFVEQHGAEKLLLEDPKTSTLGKQWLFWFDQIGLEPKLFNRLNLKLGSSWSQTYGRFKKGSADMVFSYMTSVVFHWVREKDFSYGYYTFDQGHPFQVDAAGLLDRCQQCEAGQAFIEFLLEPGSQAFIMQNNFMLPAIKGFHATGEFSKLQDVKLISYEKLSTFLNQQSEAERKYLDPIQ